MVTDVECSDQAAAVRGLFDPRNGVGVDRRRVRATELRPRSPSTAHDDARPVRQRMHVPTRRESHDQREGKQLPYEEPHFGSCAGCTSSSTTVEMSAGSEDTSLTVEYSVARPCSVVRSILCTACLVVVMSSWGTGGINSDMLQDYCGHSIEKGGASNARGATVEGRDTDDQASVPRALAMISSETDVGHSA